MGHIRIRCSTEKQICRQVVVVHVQGGTDSACSCAEDIIQLLLRAAWALPPSRLPRIVCPGRTCSTNDLSTCLQLHQRLVLVIHRALVELEVPRLPPKIPPSKKLIIWRAVCPSDAIWNSTPTLVLRDILLCRIPPRPRRPSP